MKTRMKRYIGDRKFYAMLLGIAIPIMVQNGITNFVAMIDNIMIGRVGTEQMSGVAVANQLMFVFNVSMFGMLSGAGIFGAQFFGSKNVDGFRNTFRFKVISNLLLTLAGILILSIWGEQLISLYLHDNTGTGMADATLGYGMSYLRIMMVGMVPYAFAQIYASTLREMGETVAPMRAGIVAVVTNTLLNYILIFGKFGAPRLGVEGAAIATVISRFVECALVMTWTHRRAGQFTFIKGAYQTLRVPTELTGKILKKGSPLMVNEILWSIGMAALSQCYSTYGLEVVAGMNISSTISNVCNVIWLAMGNAIAIIIGQLLGAGKMEEARDTDRKMIAFSVFCCTLVALVMLVIAPLFPRLYNTNAQSKELAKDFIMVTAVFMPQNAFLHAAYFTLRSGGRTIITFFFDSVFICCISVPLAYVLGHFTGLQVVYILIMVQLADVIKCVIGFVLVKKGVWLQNIVE